MSAADFGKLLSHWVDFDRDGLVKVRTGKVEIGQGLHDVLRQIAAEGLAVPFETVEILTPNTATGPNEGITSGSNSVSKAGVSLMAVCRSVRRRFVEAVAEAAGVPKDKVSVKDGVFLIGNTAAHTYHSAHSLVDLDVEPDAGTSFGTAADGGLLGQSLERKDLMPKLTGQKVYLSDLVFPGTIFARAIRPANQHFEVVDIPQDAIDAMPQDCELVRKRNFLAVLGPTEDLVHAASRKLSERVQFAISCDLSPLNDVASLLPNEPAEQSIVRARGETEPPAHGARISARYTKQFIAHGSIGLSCAIAWERDGILCVWTHSQGIFHLRRELATVLERDADTIEVRHHEAAGCYGHNGADDAAMDAALIATMKPGVPVKVAWTREDELANAPFGAGMVIDLEAVLGEAGKVDWWRHEIWSNGYVARPGRGQEPTLRAGPESDGRFSPYVSINTPAATGGAAERNAVPIYEFPNQHVINNRILVNRIRTSSIRSLGAFGNVFALESFIDEICGATGQCPVDFRRQHLGDERALRVLNEAVEAADFVRRIAHDPQAGLGLGLARYKNLGAYCACVAELEVDYEVSVKRLHIAVDVGQAVSPDGVINQIEGGAVQAVSWTLKEEVKFTPLGVEASNWEDYPILKFSEVPEISVHLVEDHSPPLGAGEAAQGPVAAAIANAVSRAVGARIRALPITRDRIMTTLMGEG